MARVTGLEPATSGVTGRRSNQLSYTRKGYARGPWDKGEGSSCQPPAAGTSGSLRLQASQAQISHRRNRRLQVCRLALVAMDHDFLTSTIENQGPRPKGSRSELFYLLHSADWLIVDRSNDISRPQTYLLCRRTGLNIEHSHA